LFCKSNKAEYQYAAEENGWKYIEDRKILIRNDFYKTFIKFYQEENRWARDVYHYLHVPDVAANALGVTELERINYEVSEKLMNKEEPYA